MFKELKVVRGSGGITESSKRIAEKAKDMLEAREKRVERQQRRELSSNEREVEILRSLEKNNLDEVLKIADSAGPDQKAGAPRWVRFIYDEYFRRGEFLAAARLAHMRLTEKSERPHNFTEADVRRAAISAYHAAKETPAPIEKMDEPPVPVEGYIPNDFETSDAELIKREFGLTDEDIGPSLPKAA